MNCQDLEHLNIYRILQIRIIYVRLWSGELVVVVEWELLCLGWLLWWV